MYPDEVNLYRSRKFSYF